MNRPQPEEFAPFYAPYINTVSENVMGELAYQAESFPKFLKLISDEQAYFAYAEGKWTIKEVVGHLIDTERVMAYRVLRFSRADETPLPGFEENSYVTHANFNDRGLSVLAAEFAALRQANMYLFNALTDAQLDFTGIGSGNSITVRALLYIIAGHVNHHREVISSMYLSKTQ